MSVYSVQEERRGAGETIFGFVSCPAAVAMLSLIGGVVLAFATRWGIGLYPDSIVYVGTARSILDGKGIQFLNDVGQMAPVTQYPPFYSASMAVLGIMGLDPLNGARWISVGSYVANALLVAFIAHSTTSSCTASLVACFLAMTSFPMVYIHTQALTEPIFIFLVLLGFSFLVSYWRRLERWMLHAGGVIIGVSCLVRYVGIAMIMTGALAILCLSGVAWRRRVIDTTVFLIESSALLATWVVRNYWFAGTATNRTFGFHPPSWVEFLPGLDTIAHWLIPIAVVDAAPWLSRAAVTVCFVGLCCLVGRADLSRSKYFSTLIFCFLGYVLFLLISWSLNDQPLYLDTRTMALPYVAFMILAVAAVSGWLRRSSFFGSSGPRFIFNCLGILLLAVQATNGAVWLRQSYFDGIGFATAQWRNSELLKFVKQTTGTSMIFSNAPDFIYTLTGKPAFMVPSKIDPDTRAPNKQFEVEMATMLAQLRMSNAALIYFKEGRLWYLPGIEELKALLPLQPAKVALDGTVYVLKNTGNVTTP